MADKTRYWTRDFIDAYVQVLTNDAAFQKAARKFTGKFVLRCLDLPDGTDGKATYHIDRGDVKVEAVFMPAPSAEIRDEAFDKRSLIARTTAPYALWTKLDRGEINIVQGLASSKYQVDGKLKVMANVNMFTAMSDAASRMEKDY